MRRRNFVKTTVVASTATLAGLTVYSCEPAGKWKVPGPNDTINLGIIGLGMRAKQLEREFFRIPRVQIIAGCRT